MTPQEFCYWLQGFAELQGTAPSEQQWHVIQDHLRLVFTKVTPPIQLPNQTPHPLWSPFPNQPVVIC